MINKFQNWIFDLDGTLINSSEEVLNCFKKAFAQANYKVDDSKFTSDVIGPPLKEIVNLLAPELSDENKINEVMENYRQLYDYDENDITILCDGMREILSELQKNNKKIFIATLKPEIPTKRLVKKFDFSMMTDVYTIDKFGYNIGKEEMISDIIEKYQLKKEETVMVGDALSDVLAAKKAGVTAVGVLWGYGTDKTDLIKNSDIIIKTAEELKCLK